MRIVIKVGTSTIAHPTGRLNIRHMESLCKVISDMKNSGTEVVLVSSGAIGMGVGKLNLKTRPEDMPTKQAAASIGQCELMYTYDKLFSEYNHTVAQILLTGYDVNNHEGYENFKNTMNRLLELNAIPIINENDTVSTEEIVIGDNDTLAAIVAKSMNADLLVLLSDIDGLYTADPHKNSHARLIETVEIIDENIMSLGGAAGSSLGTGGMLSKLNAAKMCVESGCDMIISNGKNPEILYDIAEGKKVGTRFVAVRR
ncbi:MAG: glutamate 5-kinase [Clostridia bacterium]|nr:glutamate 5-kinase [Clostridia bacterium]